MEWSKIKTMFIYLFLGLNILLATIYFYTINKNKTEYYLERDAIIKSIVNDNIEIIESQQKKVDIGYLSASSYNFREMEINAENYRYELINHNASKKLKIVFDTPLVNVRENINYKATLDNFVNEKLNKKFLYYFDIYDENKKVIIYRQVVDGFKIYNNDSATLSFEVDAAGDVVSLTQTALTEFKKDNLDNVASSNQAIYKLYHENFIPNNSKVIANIGYYTTASQVQNQVLLPTWRIEVKTGNKTKYYYVDAVNIKILDRAK